MLPLHIHPVFDIPIYLRHYVEPQGWRARQTITSLTKQLDRDANLEIRVRQPNVRDAAIDFTFPDAPEAGDEASSMDSVCVFNENAG